MSETSRIAAVRIAGGEDKPFYSAKLRVFYRDSGTQSGQVVKDVAGLRVLLTDADASPVEHGSVDPVHLPLLLRGYVRPQVHKGGANHGVELRLDWEGTTFDGTLVAEKPVSDVMLVPIGGWPQKLGPGIEVPELRFTGGAVQAALQVANKPLEKFLKLVTKSGKSTLFGGFLLEKPATKTLPLTLVPHGIEFDGSVPDPTRDWLDVADPAARIRGRFRLEQRPSAESKPGYWLRLVAGDPAQPEAMEQLEARIAKAFGSLGADKNPPLSVRFDRRPGVPPLLWPLDFKAGGLAFTEANAGDFEMAIEPSAIDVRLRTVSGFPGDLPGIASIHGERLAWIKQTDGFDVRITAGALTPVAPHVVVRFDLADTDWTTTLDDTFATQQIEVPLDATAALLLAAYKDGNVVAATARKPPYAFLPLTDGWLQLGLVTARIEKSAASAAAPGVMSGRVVAAHGTSADGLRGIVVDNATGLTLTMRWRKQNAAYRPVKGDLEIRGARGQLRGFVFVAETAPTAAEALPDLRRGPAATRDLPIAFNAPQTGLTLRGTFTWKPTEWKLSVTDLVEVVPPGRELPAAPSPPGAPYGFAWQVPAERPFITNHPLTRAVVTPAEPSVSRGLLNYAFDGEFSLTSAPGSDAPALTVKHPVIHQDEQSGSFIADTLILPTLPGPEFVPRQWPKEKVHFAAALRHDLPILDELFAWADPPPPKTGTDAPPAVGDAGPIVTALDPVRLAEVWRQNRVRMALTHTQDAFVTGWVATGVDHDQDIDTLVQPYTWKDIKVKVDLKPRWGAYRLDGKTYRTEMALAGLHGEFDVVGQEVVSGGTAITVRGNAASLFRRDDSDLIWDSRGTGLGPFVGSGARPVGLDGAPRGHLHTLDDAERIKVDETIPWMKGTRLAFYIRDLPIEDGVFDGAANPVEGAPGTIGQAFDRANFSRSLHEWRLMEEPTATDVPKPFDLRFGPFLFRPLRLWRVEFDGGGAIQTIKVIGTLRIGRRSQSDQSTDPEPGPFSADRIYERADLFCLTLSRQGEAWRPGWAGVGLKSPDINQPMLELTARSPEISCALMLDVDGKRGIPSAREAKVDATIVLDIASRRVRFGARVFGRACALESKATIGATIEFGFKPTGPASSPSLVLLRIDEIAVRLAAGSQSIRIDGALQLMPDRTKVPDPLGKPDEATALLHIGRTSASFRWLDLPEAEPKAILRMSIDHASGRISAAWDGRWSQALPLFGLEVQGDWTVQARLEAFVASSESLGALAPLAAASAWARISGIAHETNNRIDQRLRMDTTSTAHHLDVTWDVDFTSPVRWPVNGLHQADGSALPDKWRSPKNADSSKAGRSRQIRIDAEGLLTHHVTTRFRRHRIEAAELQRLARRVTPRTSILLLAEVEHTLTDGARSATFTILDHVAITSLSLMIETGKAYGFAPHYRQLRYRGQNTKPTAPHPGLVQLPWAVSGFFDEALIRLYGTEQFKTHLQTPLLLGGSAAMFAYRVGTEDRTVTAVVPWMGLDATLSGVFGPLTQAGGTWEVAAPDLWAGNAHIGPSVQRATVVSSQTAAQILAAIGGAGLVSPDDTARLARVLPVEQLFFENLRQGSNGMLKIGELGKPGDIATAPIFLRALMAIEACWNATPAEPKEAAWRALSLHPARGKAGGTKADPVHAVEIRPSPLQAAGAGAQVPADLIALSARRVTWQPAYRLIDTNLADDAGDLQPRAELAARARDLDRFAECAIREVDRAGRLPAVTAVEIPDSRVVAGSRGTFAIDHPVLAPSPSLGWPSLHGIGGLDKLAPLLGGERPVQSSRAGFAARFRQIGLPGHVTEAMSYLSFDNRVAYQRDLRVPFAGPAARHLSPVNTRLRAPIDAALEAPPATGPILPPFFELATIGRRPGVFEVVTAAVTVAAEDTPFDPDHPRFGRPANSGPVVAHQLRTPRSPGLPDDAADIAAAGSESDVLKVRRRTYLSLADGRRTDPDAPLILDRFGAFPESADVVRHEDGAGQLRVALSLAAAPDATGAVGLIGQNWDGLLAIRFDATSANIDDPAATLTTLSSVRTARLEIGALSFVLAEKEFPIAWPSFTWVLTLQDQLAAARDALRRATVDVPIRLVVTFSHADALPPAPCPKAVLPLALDPGDRRVLRSRTRTIAFGDPSYDRQLGSEAEGDVKQVGDARALLSVDRQEYDPGAMLYFACDTIDPATGLFASDSPGPQVTMRFRRFGKPNPDGSVRAPEKLFVAGGPQTGDVGDGYQLPRNVPYELALRRLRRVGAGVDDISPLEPGDRLEVSADITNGGDAKTLTVLVNIVAAPVIAPPPCVYTVIDSMPGAQTVSRAVLHAAAPLPQHVEHPNLRDDLAKGYVNRRALFIWRFTSVGAGESEIELVKFDRSGGAQLPANA